MELSGVADSSQRGIRDMPQQGIVLALALLVHAERRYTGKVAVCERYFVCSSVTI